jgi:hypothetical protein
MLQKLIDLYEDKKLKLWRFNPCDAWAAPVFRPLGRALARLAGDCSCCAGARLVTAAALAALYPTATILVLGAALVLMTAHEAYKGEPDES